jgi:hypothetical protein
MSQQEEDVLSLEDSGSECFDTAEAGSSADEMEDCLSAVSEGMAVAEVKGPPSSKEHCHYALRVPNTSPTALYLLPGMPVTPRADKISHGLCLFLCYLYTFTMIPFFALVTPDHELSPVWFPTNTIKLIPIPTLIFDAPLLRVISCPLNDLLTQEF